MRIFGGTLGRRRCGEVGRWWAGVVVGVVVLSGCERLVDGWRRMRGDALRHAGEHVRAIAWYEQIPSNRQDAAVLRGMLLSYQALGMTSSVRGIVERLGRMSADARELEAMAEVRLGEEDEEGAVLLLERAVGLLSNRWNSHARLIEIHLQRGATNAAVAATARAERWLPRNARNRRRLASAWLRVGEMTNAARQLSEVVAEDAHDSTARLMLAVVQLQMKDHVGAVSNLRQVVAAEPGNAVAVGALADALHEMGEVKEAIEWYRRAIRLDQRNAVMLNNLAYVLLLHTSNIGEAIELARSSVAIERTAYGLDTLGYAYYLRGQDEVALRYLREAEELWKGRGEEVDAEIELHLGMVHGRRGELEEAAERIGKALRAQPGLEKYVEGCEWYERVKRLMSDEGGGKEGTAEAARHGVKRE
ncbi:MAG: tetratricopeptide repeat protein [bacterium]|nr:tetratricopeptide repeat protein [bacterium]